MSVLTGRVTRLGRRLGRIAAAAALVGLATLVAHQATYLASTGSATAYDEAMSAGGHDGTWLPLVTLVLVAVVLLTAAASRHLLHLSARAGGHARPHRAVPSTDGYARIVGALWLRVAAATFVAYALLENAERVLAGLAPPGMDALAVHGPLPIVVILVSSFLVAAITALVRWRCRALLARIATGSAPVRHRSGMRLRVPPAPRPARPWADSSASRAPPRLLPAA